MKQDTQNGMKRVTANVDQMQAFVTINSVGMMICDKGLIWNPSNCECECDKSCDVGEYLDYGDCNCTKNLVDKLVDECTKNVEEVKLGKITYSENKNKRKQSSCTLYIVLFSIIFIINVRFGIYFVYYKQINRDKKSGAKEQFYFLGNNYQMQFY